MYSSSSSCSGGVSVPCWAFSERHAARSCCAGEAELQEFLGGLGRHAVRLEVGEPLQQRPFQSAQVLPYPFWWP